MTEISDRVLRNGGPALLFENAQHEGRPAKMPVLANLFGTPRRVAWGMGADEVSALRDIGELLASLREPEAPRNLREAIGTVSTLKSALWDMSPKRVRGAPCHDIVPEGDDVNLADIPLQHCWPDDAAPPVPRGRGGTARARGRRRPPRRYPASALLARRRGPAVALGTGDPSRPACATSEPGHLPTATDRPQQADHAMAVAPRRSARLPRSLPCESRPALP